MLIKNGLLFAAGSFRPLDISFGETINRIAENLTDKNVIDATGCYVVPGFVDIHIHGANGTDFCDARVDSIENTALFLAQKGVTSYCPTTMAYDEETLSKILSTYKEYNLKPNPKASCTVGINLEGPFLAKNKKGAHEEKYIIPPDYRLLKRLDKISGKAIRFVDMAPEADGAMEFIKKASEEFTVSLAHTNADYDLSLKAYENGAGHLTHLFNAMTPFTHRQPGVIGAAADKAKFAELICDGIHVHPAAVRMAFSIFGYNRICLISDCIRAGGLSDGDYSLGGQAVKVSKGKATLSDGTIAGSATVLSDCLKKAVEFGIPLEHAITAASVNPAKACGIFHKTGSLTTGKNADILILDNKLNVKCVFIKGQQIKQYEVKHESNQCSRL